MRGSGRVVGEWSGGYGSTARHRNMHRTQRELAERGQKASRLPSQDPKEGQGAGSGQGEEGCVCPLGMDLLVCPGLYQCLCSHGSSLVTEPLCSTWDSIWEELSGKSTDCRKEGELMQVRTQYCLLCFIKGLMPVFKTSSILGASVVLLSFCPR